MRKYIVKIFINLTIILLSLLLFSCNNNDNAIVTSGTSTSNYSQYGTPYNNIPQTKDVIMYEVNLRAFGPDWDFQSVINRLNEIDSLRVNVIWLMPIYPIGKINSVNSPYSVQDYKQVNPEFGSLDDLRQLVAEAHSRNIAVILDWVANHTAWDNPWITNKTWYTQDANGNIIHPAGTNWQDVADLNYSNQDMCKAMVDAMEYWVYEANIDGFRCDAADMVPFDFWKQAIDSLNNIPNHKLILLAEGARTDHFTAGFQMNYSWDFYNQLKDVFSGQSATQLYSTHLSEYSNIPADKQKLRFTTNHDESAWNAAPMVNFNGKNGSLAAFVISTYMGGVPLIYGSQEVGTVNNVPFFSNSTIEWNNNPDILQEYKNLMNFYSTDETTKIFNITNYSNSNIVCFKKATLTEQLLVIANVRNQQINFSIPVELQNSTWKNVLLNENLVLNSSLSLNNYSYLILTN